MYLKSLVLKGFKSFADRSVLTVEPGITAIVGPNGSGKSNISDAVLWVLGERSAKNLRGQAMEDIIFSGSAARKAVSVAEVELVLDNSDGTIPVDFDEVSIARRMYRSGESEYLVNGAVVRRLDVLEILHDSGLGTGTHSIISQGSLDSILQSKPEDRRALIEEAAGVLKHKQRKERSARKIAAMDHHLDRVRDVTAEVERQLGPLERKAKRAKAYQEAKSKLSEVRLSLAVDDLRQLQAKWKEVCASETTIEAELETVRQNVDVAEKKVNDVQEAMRRETADAGELTRKQRKSSQLAERLDGCEKVLRERRRGAVDYRANLSASLESHADRLKAAVTELEASKASLDDVSIKLKVATEETESLGAQAKELGEKRTELDAALREVDREIRNNESELQDVQRSKVALQEGLSSGLAHERLIEARSQELAGSLENAKAELEAATAVLKDAESSLAALKEEEDKAQAELVRLFESREAARNACEEARSRSAVAESELKAIERGLAAMRSDNDSLSWVIDNSNKFDGIVKPLAQMLKAPQTLETVVERLLGEDISALAIDDAAHLGDAVNALLGQQKNGDVVFVPAARPDRHDRADARKTAYGKPLVEFFDTIGSERELAELLFGDVVMCETTEEAFEAHENDKLGLRFATTEGLTIWPSGKVRVYGKSASSEQSVLARERQCGQLRVKIAEIASSIQELESARDAVEADYRAIQARSLQANEAHANQRGAVSAARSDQERAAQRLESCAREFENIQAQAASARETVSDLRPKVEEVDKLIDELTEARNKLASKRADLQERANPLMQASEQLSEKLSSAKLEKARLDEREAYAKRMVVARENDIEALERSGGKSRRTVALKSVAIDRASAAIDQIEQVAISLQRRIEQLDAAIALSESATNTAHESASKARIEARQAHDQFDEVSQRMTQVKVEKSRLEVQVDAAVRAVVADCGVPLETASELPNLVNRREAEDEAFKLERRIKNMGAISPEAEEEYAALKERYDFLAGQLSDMESAKKSLRRIMKVIDERMKDDFARTFDQVNQNFSEVFSTLFPGGSASLSLEDPDDIENSGVEVTAQPRGKRLTKMMLMSGGEKSLTALALLFAVYKTRSTPFYILDEVEAALDDTNLRRLMSYIDTLRNETQLIMITHQRRTMEMADVLFGVSMQADGVTKVISQKLERALEQAE